jgi:hypothetical protein
MRAKLYPLPLLSLAALFFLFSSSVFSQAETHNFITYDTIYNGNYGTKWGIRISRPANMFTPGNADTASRPAIITMPGIGQMGSVNPSFLTVWGPHYWLLNGWDGSVVLGNGKHYPILITVTDYTSPWPVPEGAADVLSFLLNTYHIKRNSVHLGGLSEGSFTWTGMIAFEQTPLAETGMKMVTSLTALEGFSFMEDPPYSTWSRDSVAYKVWAAKYHGKFFGLEGNGSDNFRNVWQGSNPMNDSVPGSAYFSFEDLGGGSHCCWNSMYDPSATNWTSVGVLGPNNTPSQVYPGNPGYNAMGTYIAPENIFQWMLRQGDTTMIGNFTPPVANAGSNITLIYPVNSTTLNGSGSTDPNGGTIVSYTWSMVSGPSQYTLANDSSATPLVSNLAIGTYVFQLAVTDDLGLSDTTQVQVLATFILPLEFLSFNGQNNSGINDLTWETTDASGQFGLERSADGKDFVTITTIQAPSSGPENQTYSYADVTTPDGLSYYRVKNTNETGLIMYSKTIQVTNNQGQELISFYPNPAKDFVLVQLQSAEKGVVLFQILDAEGRIISQQQGTKTDDLYSGTIYLNNAAPGLYFVNCNIANVVHHLGKIIKN